MDKEIQKVLDQPKRVRYTMIPNQLFDPKYKNNPQKNYEEIVELQAYEYLRRETLKNIKLMFKPVLKSDRGVTTHETFLAPAGRFWYAGEIENLEILHPDFEMKENHSV